MFRSKSVSLLRRAHEHLLSSVAAIAVTTVMLASVNTHAATRDALNLKPSVTILVPTVTIEQVDG